MYTLKCIYLKNLQVLICNKIQPHNNVYIYIYIYIYIRGELKISYDEVISAV